MPREAPECGPRISVVVWCNGFRDGGCQARAGVHSLGDFPHMFYSNPKGEGEDYEAKSVLVGSGDHFMLGPSPQATVKGVRKPGSPSSGNRGVLREQSGHSCSEAVDLDGRGNRAVPRGRDAGATEAVVSRALVAAKEATRALTLQGAQQVFAILRGVKLIENRGWRMPSGWYAVHAGAERINAERAERTRRAWPDVPPEESLPHGAICGLFYVQESRLPRECREGYIWARGPWCHLISQAVELPRPIKCHGNKGLWGLSEELRRQIGEQLVGVPVTFFDLSPAIPK